MGKRGRVEGRVSKFLFLIHQNLEHEIHSRGAGRFVTPYFLQKE
jgi:hypothetical protein